MAFPGIISRLHLVAEPEMLNRQLRQGQQTRSEAFWLPETMHAQAAVVLASLSGKSSLFLERPAAGLSLRIHDGVLQEDGGLLCGNGKRLILAQEKGDGGLVPDTAFSEMALWLEAGHRHFICPAAVQPVARAILNIWPLDPYLARHFLHSFTPLLWEATEADYLAVFEARENGSMAHGAWAEAYMKLEKKLHRAHLGH